MQNRRYIASGTFLSLTTLFHVPQENSIIRLVYDLKACGMNEALWDPKLWMTSVDKVLDTENPYSWFGYVYYVEMFHNYKLPEKVHPYAG